MAESTHETTVLNSLIGTLIDSIDGYRTSAESADSRHFAEQFRSRATERTQVVSDMRATVRQLGGDPEDDGTLLAAAHRAFVNLRGALSGTDDTAVLEEVERGEDHLKDKFETALADTELGAAARQAVSSAYQSVRRGHDEMKSLRNRAESNGGTGTSSF